MMKFWLGLPIWSRWILCWPVILAVSVVTLVIGQAMISMAVDRIWITDDFGEMISPVIASLVSLPFLMYAIQYLVPRKQHYVVAILCVIYLIATLNGAFWLYVEAMENADEVWWTLRDTVWAALALAIGMYYFVKFKNENS